MARVGITTCLVRGLIVVLLNRIYLSPAPTICLTAPTTIPTPIASVITSILIVVVVVIAVLVLTRTAASSTPQSARER